MQVLLICDNEKEQAVLPQALRQVGVGTTTVQDVEAALRVWETRPADLILLVQRGSPLAAVRRLRTTTIVPLVVIVDELPEDEQVALVEEGKALLITRPYRLRVLMSQIPLLLQQSDGVPAAVLAVLKRGEVTLNPANRTVRVGEQPAQRLSKLEANLLYVLMQHAGQVLPAETLLEQVWGYDAGDKGALQKAISRLRKKLEPDPKQPRYLLTDGETGYTFRGK